jgi:isopenicillin N synthase-like dioxygenase
MPHSDHALSPSAHSFADLPPFPDNVPTAPLLRISLEKLLEHDPAEEERCWKACRELGFFYLDLRTSAPLGVTRNDGSSASDSGEDLLRDADELFGVMQKLFDLDLEEKVKYDFKAKGSYYGYKGAGEGIVDDKGTRDRNEFYNVSPP